MREVECAFSNAKPLIEDIRGYFNANPTVDKVFSFDLVAYLNKLQDRPWAGSKSLTQNKLARLLKPLDILPTDIRIGAVVCKGYTRKTF